MESLRTDQQRVTRPDIRRGVRGHRAGVSRPQRQNLPVVLPRVGEKVKEPQQRIAQVAEAPWARQRRGMEQHAGRPPASRGR